MKGYMGTILEINLTDGSIKKTPLDEKLAQLFLGGAGYACAALLPLLSKDTDPLGPDNKLFFMTGPLTGTMATSTGRMVVCAKSPLTDILGESNTGSDICVQIKKAGYDGIMIHGAAKSPVYIEILDDQVEIKDASELWGKKIYETTEILKKIEKFKRPRVMAIGPAGENLVKYSIIGSEERAFGRTGMGAVMGSKKLKAIVIQGTKKVEVADPDAFKEHTKATNAGLMEVFTNEMFQELGTSAGLDMYNVNGELPTKYYHLGEYDDFDNISGATLAEKYLTKNRHCYACPIGCGRVVKVGENPDGLPTENFEGPEYETLAGFGSIMLNNDLYAILKANYICNDLGLDTISSSSIIALLMDQVDQGKIKTSDLDGIDVKWGNMDAVFKLIDKISYKEGIGEILAQGTNAIIDKFGIDKEQVAAIRNSHITYHDMRSSNGMALAYGISPHYGGSHNSCDAYMVTTGMEINDLGITSDDNRDNGPDMAIMSAKLMNYRAFSSSAIFCVLSNPTIPEIAKFLELGLGSKWDVKAIEVISDRILTIKRLFNLKMGHTPKDERIPKLLLVPIQDCGQEGNVPDFPALKSEFYKFMEWDAETGMVSKEKLDRLGLNDFAL
jgi:aldehyde:ferredoxin oxidoreductase